MAKDIIFDEELRAGLVRGMSKLADTVAMTLGPRGRNAMMYQPPNLHEASGAADPTLPAQPGAPIYVSNDGVTIARSIALPDPYENLGAELLKEAAIRTNEEAGDGTTTAVILTRAILEEGIRNVTAGAHPLAVKRGIDTAVEAAKTALAEMAVRIDTRKDISRVAAISCQDQEIGEMIGEAFDRIGLEGVVTVDTLSRSGRTELDVQEGIVFEKGFMNERMITNRDTGTAELYDPYIFITDFKLSTAHDIVDILILAAEQDKDILIIAEEVSGEAMGIILRNTVDGDIKIVCVEPPMYGEGRRWRMEDLALQTGGRFVSKEKGDSLADVKLEDFGSAGHVSVARKQTVITDAKGDPQAVENRIKELRHLAANTDYEFNRERYKERLAKFVSGVATIQAGGDTDVEIKDRKLRIEDAINAARAAIQEGIVPGGGTALIDVIPGVEAVVRGLDGDEKIGGEILLKALERPCWQVAENAGVDPGTVVTSVKRRRAGIGFDASRMEYTDMIKRGIIDPVKVTRLALETAASVASTVLTSNAGIAEKKDRQ